MNDSRSLRDSNSGSVSKAMRKKSQNKKGKSKVQLTVTKNLFLPDH